jgi:hypothetical protein
LPEFDEVEAVDGEASPDVALPTAGLPQPAHARSTVVGTNESEQMREVLGLPQRPNETPALREALAEARLGFSETDAEIMRAALGIPAPPPSQPRAAPLQVDKPAPDQVDTSSLSEEQRGPAPLIEAVPFEPPAAPPQSEPVLRAATTRSGHEAPHDGGGRATITLADGEPSLERVLPFAFSDRERPLEAELPDCLHAPVSAAPEDEDPPRLAPTMPPPAMPPDEE